MPSASDKSFFLISPQKLDGQNQLIINTDIWNNASVVAVTGYTIEMLKQPLYEMSMFIRNNLSPDRLEGFDIQHVLSVKNFPVLPAKH